MYRLIYMKADYEPWWQFEGWQEHIVEAYCFDTKEACEEALQKKVTQFRQQYVHEMKKHEKYYAFWSEDEVEYCEACEDDTQMYHGLFIEQVSYIPT